MKTRGCGQIEIEIGVVDIVKAPANRHRMHGVMPPVVGPVHEQHARDRRCPDRDVQPMQQAEMMLLRPPRDAERYRNQGESGHEESRDGKDKIAHQPPHHGEALRPQGPPPLQAQERGGEADEKRSRERLEKWKEIHRRRHRGPREAFSYAQKATPTVYPLVTVRSPPDPPELRSATPTNKTKT